MLLHQPRQRIQVFGALMARQLRPFRLCPSCCGHGAVDIGRAALGHKGQHIARGGVARGKGFTRCRKRPVDPMAKLALVLGQPRQHLGIAFRGRAVGHGVKDIADGHERLHVKRRAWGKGLPPAGIFLHI